jgi:hypothetical protein
MRMEPCAWGYIWATLFLVDINMGIWSRVPRDLDLRMTVLARASINCKRQTRPIIRENKLLVVSLMELVAKTN